MALTSATRKVTYTGNGATKAFAFAYLFFASSDLVVEVDGATKTLATDYTVSGAGEQAGGTVTFGTAPADAAAITIERVVDFTQPTSLRTQGNYSPKVHENALDRATMGLQQLDARVTTAQADADALDVRVTAAEADIDALQAHDASEDAAVDLIDARVSALEAGDSPPAPTTEDYTGVAAAISARTAPTITRPADGSSLTAESLQTPLDVLADKVASILAHGGLLDVAGTWSAVQTFSAQPVMSAGVKFSDTTTQTTAPSTLTAGTLVTATDAGAGGTVKRTVTGLVEAHLVITPTASFSSGATLGTITESTHRPAAEWDGCAWAVVSGVASLVRAAIDTSGNVAVRADLANGDQAFLTAVYLGG